MKKKFYITTPIYYVNDKPHVGHAYTTIAADVLARFHRLQGKDVFLLTGTDEHGLKIQHKAEESGKEPQKFVDEISAEFQKLWDKLDIKYDNFIRTTDKNHKKAVEKVLQTLYDKGAIYKGEYEGLYCVACEQFRHENELIDGRCPDHDIVLEKVKEECYLLKLNELQEKLIELIEKNEFSIQPERYKKEILSFLKSGPLKDISVSRKKVSWGIPLPFDKEHTTYVWVDAFLNYLTGLGWDGNVPRPNLGTSQGSALGNLKFWPPNIQLIGKDILRVHATIWPAILMHLEIPLPKMIFVHGHILSGGRKMSKTVGNVIGVDEMLNKFGVDGTRYLLMSAGTFGEDVDATMERMVEKYNADLANGISNLVYRTLSILEKNGDNQVPDVGIKKMGEDFKIGSIFYSGFSDDIERYVSIYKEILHKKDSVNFMRVNRMLQLICSSDIESKSGGFFVKKLNSLIQDSSLWDLRTRDTGSYNDVVYRLLESFRLIAWLLMPFMPKTSGDIFLQLGLDENKEKSKEYGEAIKWGGLKPGTKLGEKKILFRKK